ncbi:MAG: hypothetical protein ACMUIS_12435 [bacterium]
MKKTLAVILSLPLCVAFIMSVFARAEGMRGVFTGEIIRINEVAQTISVTDSEGVEVFDISNTMFDEEFGIDAFRVGDMVDVEFEEKDGKKAAIVIMLKPNIPATETPADEPEEEKIPAHPTR